MHKPGYLTDEDLYQGLQIETAAMNAYRHYGDAVGGTTWDGKPIPEWHLIKGRQRNGWRNAVVGALRSWLTLKFSELVPMIKKVEDEKDAG